MNIVKVKKTELRASLASDATSIALRKFVDSNDNELALSDFGSFFIVVVKQSDQTEIIRCNGITQNADGTADLAIETSWRNVPAKPPFAGSTTGKAFQTGAEVIVSNDPYTMSFFLQTNNTTAQTVVGDIRFPTPSHGSNAATKDYADGLVAAGAPTASQTVRGIAMLSESPDVTIGAFTVTIATPAVFTFVGHGLQVNDTVKFTTTGALPTGLATDTDYYVIATGLTSDAFQVSTSLGGAAVDTSGVQNGVHTLIRTTPYVVTETDGRLLTTEQKTALGGISVPLSVSNKVLSQEDVKDVSVFPIPVVKKHTLNNIFGDSTTQFDITNPSGSTFRYTWDGNGTTPNISAATVPVSTALIINGQNFNAGNNGTFVVTASGTNYFEITNVSGVTENNVTLGTGAINYGWVKPAGLRFVRIQVQAAGGGSGANTNSMTCSGAGGAYSEGIFAASALAASEIIIAGLGGLGGVIGGDTNGQVGGQSKFGSLIVCNGGGRSVFEGTSSTGGTVATPGNLLSFDGTDGSYPMADSGATAAWMMPTGGQSFLSIPALLIRQSGTDRDFAGVASKGYGYGGASVGQDSQPSGVNGKQGGHGVVIITEYF